MKNKYRQKRRENNVYAKRVFVCYFCGTEVKKAMKITGTLADGFYCTNCEKIALDTAKTQASSKRPVRVHLDASRLCHVYNCDNMATVAMKLEIDCLWILPENLYCAECANSFTKAVQKY